jgi:biopolymer transport protein ExbB
MKSKSSAFLKKRTKKLLLIGVRGPFRHAPSRKSFLVLFFKKELLAFCLMLSVAFPALAASGDWFNGDWQYRTKIDADLSSIGEPIGRTAVLVKLTQGNFKFEQAKDDGSDLRFVAADGKTLLHYHVELWDGLLNQVALIWVDVPDLAPGATSSFYMYWGNPKAPDISDSKETYDDNQLLVWHFGSSTKGLPHDSTQYKFDGLTSATPEQAGEIGWGARLDGSTPLKLPDNKLLHLTAGQPLTWQLWVSPNPAAQTSVLYDQRDAGGVADLQIGLAAGVPYVQATPATGAPVLARAGSAMDPKASWHLLTVTASAQALDLYVDGNKVAEAPGSLPDINGAGVLGGAAVAVAPPAATAPAAAAPAPAAPTAPAAAPANFTGLADQLEISNVVRPEGAVLVAVHGEGVQNNLLKFEAPEQTSTFSTGYIGILLHSITPDAEFVIGILMVMMLISWLVMGNRAIVVGSTRGANKRFMIVLRETLRANGRDIMPTLPKDGTKNLRGSSLYAIYQTGYREVHDRLSGGRCLPDGTIAPQSLAAIRSAMDGQMVREQQRLNNLMVLLTIAISGGPFIGLLGTVIGVMITFAAIAAAGDVNVNSIAPGIAAALLATVAGLSVAIPSLFGYNYFQTRIKETMSEMAVFVDEIVTRIAEGDVGRDNRMPGE